MFLFFRMTKSRKIFYAQSEGRGFHTGSVYCGPSFIVGEAAAVGGIADLRQPRHEWQGGADSAVRLMSGTHGACRSRSFVLMAHVEIADTPLIVAIGSLW